MNLCHTCVYHKDCLINLNILYKRWDLPRVEEIVRTDCPDYMEVEV